MCIGQERSAAIVGQLDELDPIAQSVVNATAEYGGKPKFILFTSDYTDEETRRTRAIEYARQKVQAWQDAIRVLEGEAGAAVTEDSQADRDHAAMQALRRMSERGPVLLETIYGRTRKFRLSVPQTDHYRWSDPMNDPAEAILSVAREMGVA